MTDPDTPAKPPTKGMRDPQPAPESANEPPAWFHSDDAGRPSAPDPASWATPPVGDYLARGPEWEPRESDGGREFLSRTGVVVLAVAIVIAGAVIALSIARSGGDEAAPFVAATPTPTPSPSPGKPGEYGPNQPPGSAANPSLEAIPTVPEFTLPPQDFAPIPPPDPADAKTAVLQANPLYDIPAPTLEGCPEPSTPQGEQEWRDIVRLQWRCVHESWVPVFERQDWPTEMPEVFFFPGAGSKSDCGYYEAPAFYCGLDGGSVFFGGEHLQMATQWDLSVNEMVNHEYGHHVQLLAGISDAWAGGDVSDVDVRRSELQAVCWSAMMTVRNTAVGFDLADYESWSQRLQTMRESHAHGNRAALVEWGTRGLYAETVGDCNTWTSPADDVS